LIGGQCDSEFGVSTWANGKKGNGLAGTWVDAEDGVLGKHPIEQGAVDCTVGFDLGSAGPNQPRSLTHWLCMGTRLSEVTKFGQQKLVEEGYFLHKYTPYGNPGSSWLPWVDSHGARTLPIQEDETGLVLWSLWQHYRLHRNLDFVVGLYSNLIVPAADWMVSYVD